MTAHAADPVAFRRLASPLGRIEVVGDGASIIGLTIERADALPHDALDERPDAITDRAVTQLEEYFSGSRRHFDVPVSFARGTVFQRAIWEQLVGLSWGEVASYGQLGARTGRPGAGRAVGGAVGANPVPIIVPCHRVLGASGVITGYSAGDGIPTKAWLLEHEGIPHTLPAMRRDDTTPLVTLPDDESAA